MMCGALLFPTQNSGFRIVIKALAQKGFVWLEWFNCLHSV
ncbi:hypothetical protein BURCENBC7_AP2310 [Burkholderia cenocepacia BC7]|nr:hypothetical protein BURCENK562V_C4017 [Burkholderia cenocepacia K56-2Valvano]ERI30067.1 hypothetical protein BURCENBC7_AP2310 [Burkholderia cenocepacia BC7]